jgi:hypothetical protein
MNDNIRLNLYIPRELRNKLKAKLSLMETSMSAWVREKIEELLDS